MILDYLNKYAQKAYREVTSIITSPTFLFSNDPTLTRNEATYNYLYIHGFNRLIKNNRISSDKLIEVFSFLEKEIEVYLMKHYTRKNFIYYLNADALVPAFTITIVSHYEDKEVQESVSLVELIDWYKENACFDGLEIITRQIKDESKEAESKGAFPDSVKTYTKTINT
ncbi:hypothetical protein [Paenibacillus pabuli]|uniref:hypothetical protein n=1 Tax=Paenibacillus pabuli TaxID=1472 RepID=UPI0007861E4B|nr:hypothetical protein [Paenibacillus pabuli]MEC0126489.1 hypothetical protein [Paenibacillus pabuli]